MRVQLSMTFFRLTLFRAALRMLYLTHSAESLVKLESIALRNMVFMNYDVFIRCTRSERMLFKDCC